MKEVKVGQVWRSIQMKFVITEISKKDKAYVTFITGTNGEKYLSSFNNCFFIAEYPTWQEAVNSKEFNQ